MSVNFVETDTEDVRLADGSRCLCVTRARIDHVTITNRPIYQGTAVWPADVTGEVPPRLARLADKWNRGWQQWLDGRSARDERARRRRAIARSSPPRKPSSATEAIRAALAPRQATYAAMRMKWGAAFAADRYPDGIWGHVCFTQAGGFDGDFAKLIRARR